MRSLRILAFSLSFMVGITASAAEVVVTDCASSPVVAAGKSTRINVGTDDLVLQCALQPLPGTEKVKINANVITIDGPSGTIVASGKGNAVDIVARDEIFMINTSIEATNGNGSIRVRSRNGIDIRNSLLSTGDGTRPGRKIDLSCSDRECLLELLRSNILGHKVRIRIGGEVDMANNLIRTRGNLDRIDIRSNHDSAYVCCSCLEGFIEGKVTIMARDQVDMCFTKVVTGQVIDIKSGKSGSGKISLFQATLSNDFGKKGNIKVEAAGGSDQVIIEQATLIDDDRRGEDVSEINGREELPHTGFNNIVGIPDLDI